MDEDISKFVNEAVRLIEDFDENPSKYTATILECQLTIMKIMMGVDKFDELPHFRRYLDKASKYLNSLEQQKQK